MSNLLKSSTLFLFAILYSTFSFACDCKSLKLGKDIALSDNIFIGKVLEKTIEGSDVTYQFEVDEVLKGDPATTFSVLTGLGGPDCGASFIEGSSYVVFSQKGTTNSCKPNEKLESSVRLGLIRYHLQNDFKEQIAMDDNMTLNEAEAFYFNTLLFKQRGTFDFTDKNVAYYAIDTEASKQDFFTENGGREPLSNLIILTEEEQASTGYHAILVTWREKGVSNGFRKRMIKDLTK